MYKRFSAVSALILLFFTFSAFAQKDQIAVKFLVFESSRDYIKFDGSATFDPDYQRFQSNLATELASGVTKMIAEKNFLAPLGEETVIGKQKFFEVSSGTATFPTKYYENFFTITPNLVGGYDNATSNTVYAWIFYETAKNDNSLKVKNLPVIDHLNFTSKVSSKINTVSVFAASRGSNPDGRQTYIATYFARP